MKDIKPIPKRELLAYRADIKNEIFRQIRTVFHALKQTGLTQRDLAARLSIDEGLLSRRLRGEHDMRLETFSDLARGLGCRIDVRLSPLAEVIALNKSGRLVFTSRFELGKNVARLNGIDVSEPTTSYGIPGKTITPEANRYLVDQQS